MDVFAEDYYVSYGGWPFISGVWKWTMDGMRAVLNGGIFSTA